MQRVQVQTDNEDADFSRQVSGSLKRFLRISNLARHILRLGAVPKRFSQRSSTVYDFEGINSQQAGDKTMKCHQNN